MKKRLILFTGVILMAGFLTGCIRSLFHIPYEVGSDGVGPSAVSNESAVVSLAYSVGGMREFYQYALTTEGDVRTLTYSTPSLADDDPLSCEVDEELTERIHELYRDHRAAEWDGYAKCLTEVLDGSDFSLAIGFADGKTMSVSGSNCSPDGFHAFEKELLALLEPYRERMKEELRQKKLAEGLSGTPTTLSVTFIDHGTSGDLSFEAVLRPDYDDPDQAYFDFTRKPWRDDGTALSLYGRVPKDFPKFEEIGRLMTEYGLAGWYNWDKTAADYENSQWFQLSAEFDDGTHLSACGTEHPERYEEFRDALIELLTGQAEDALELPDVKER